MDPPNLVKMDPPKEPDQRKQSLYLPSQLLEEANETAQRKDRSLSWVVRDAWEQAREYLIQGKLSQNPYTRDRQRRSIYFPLEMIAEIQSVGDNHRRSVSWLVTQAWIYSQLRK